jgi:hypothetical protein
MFQWRFAMSIERQLTEMTALLDRVRRDPERARRIDEKVGEFEREYQEQHQRSAAKRKKPKHKPPTA